MNRRIAGIGSSPILPTKSKRTKLWNRLRKYDSQISFLRIRSYPYGILDLAEFKKKRERFLDIDLKRKAVRAMLKGYKSK